MNPLSGTANIWAPRILSLMRMGMALLFFQHGAEKIWGFAGARVDHNFATLRGWAGPIEVIGGTLLLLGLFTRPTAFILCGEMAVAYFTRWAPRGFWPINNGGEEAVINCFIFLWLVTAGAGPWSLDALLASRKADTKPLTQRLASWEPHVRSIARAILAFTFSLHGFRHLFGLFPGGVGRQSAMAIDQLPPMFGVLELAGGLLLLLGVMTRPVAFVLCLEVAAAYIFGSAPRGPWPVRNGGNEALIYLCAFAYFAAAGAGAWAIERRETTPEMRRVAVP